VPIGPERFTELAKALNLIEISIFWGILLAVFGYEHILR
jgi:hypothetical protein